MSASVDDVLRRAEARGIDRLDASLLLAHRLGRTRTWLRAHPEHDVDPSTQADFEADCSRRLDGVPTAYLLGRKEFHGLELGVTADVLVPRPETETLVNWALEWLHDGPLRALECPRVLDLGTGSGAIALAIAHGCRRARVSATDRSPAALAVARANGDRLGLAVSWRPGDWWQAVGDERFDLVLSNPPYIAAADPHLAALRHEPADALVAGDDGLSDLRRIVADAAKHVDGWLMLEHGWNQASDVTTLLRRCGGEAIQTRQDLAGHARCSAACWRAPDG